MLANHIEIILDRTGHPTFVNTVAELFVYSMDFAVKESILILKNYQWDYI